MIRKRFETNSSNEDHEESFESFQSTDSKASEREWRKNLTSVRDRLSHILENDDIPKDIIFVVGEQRPEKISAHKFILQLSSPVFESLLFTQSIQNNYKNHRQDDTVAIYHLRDTDPAAFKYLLKFIYTDSVNIDAAGTKVVISLLHLLKQYEIDGLTDICCERLKSCISIDDVICILDTATKFKHDELYDCALAFILRNGTEILESWTFLEISYENACSILNDDGLAVSELTVFKAAYRWAQKKCDTENETKSPQNIRFFMRDVLYLVRFPLMTPDEFMLNVANTGVLFCEEKAEILQYISVSDPLKSTFSPQQFSCQQRTGIFGQILISTSNGSESKFLQESRSGQLSCISINNQTLDFGSFLIKCLDLKTKARTIIDTVSFQNIRLKNFDQNVIQYIRLLNLKVFNLELTCPLGSEEEFNMIDVLRNNFGRFLFFTKKAKYYPWPWALSFIWSLNVNIFISLNGTIFLNVNHETKSIVINQLGQIFSIIKSLKASQDVRSFTISLKEPETELLIKSMTIAPISSVQILTLHYASHIQNLREYIGLFHNLTDLTLVQCEYKTIELDAAIASPEKLRKLSIHQAQVGFIFEEPISFAICNALEELTLWNCLWEEELEERFPIIFPNLKEVHVYNSFMDKPLFGLLDHIIKLEKIEKIVISGFIWGNGNILRKEMNSKHKSEMKKFLSKAGVGRNCQPSFCLTKEYVNSEKGYQWVARMMMHNEVSAEIFHRFHYDKFTDFKTFILRWEQDY